MATTDTQRRSGTVRSLRGFLADSAYAYLGLGSAAVELVRSIDRVRVETPQRARAIGKEAPERLRHFVQGSVTGTLGLPGRAAREFDGLARRGRDLAGAIRTNQATLEAIDRTRTARSRLKAAGTSVSRAAESTVQATERAATIVADRTEPAQRHEIDVQTPSVQPPRARVSTRRTTAGRSASTRRSSAGRAPAKPRRSASATEDLGQRSAEALREQARKSGIEGRASMTKDELASALAASPSRGQTQTQTGPYEERTVEELQERARELGIEGRASMTKDELIKALREHRS